MGGWFGQALGSILLLAPSNLKNVYLVDSQ